MCFFDDQPRRRHQGRSHDDKRTIKRMDQLGYELEGPVRGRHPLTQERISFYPVCDFFGHRIALLAAANGFVIATQLYLDRDDRDADHRPLASDVLLSFWKYVAQQPVISLRVIVFQTVEEPGTQHVKRRVYTALDKRPSRAVSLDCRSQGTKKAEFDRVRDHTKLGRCVRTIATEYTEMKDAHAGIAQFEFVPQDSRGDLLHFVVTLGYGR